MKRSMRRIVSLVMAVFMSYGLLSANLWIGREEILADEWNGPIVPPESDFEYIVNDDQTVTITRYNGGETDITFPAQIDGRQVVQIGSGEYYDPVCVNVISAVIPEGVRSLGDFAFAYHRDSGKENQLSSIILPESLESIGFGAFWACQNLISIRIPAGVTNIDGGANILGSAYNITSIDVASDNQYYCSVDGVLFDKDMETLIYYSSAKSDAEYTVPASVKHIGANAIMYNRYLNAFEVSEGVTDIGINAFWGLSNLKTVTIPSTMENMENTYFSHMPDLVVICNEAVNTDVMEKVNECQSVMQYRIEANGEATITDYNGTVSSITIPSTVGGHAVTGIENEVVDNSTDEITIEGNITINSDITVKSGQTIIIADGGSLTVGDGVMLNNEGTVINNGTLDNSGVISNNGTMCNTGTVKVDSVQIPDALTAVFGQTLADVILPDGLEWESGGDTPVGDVGQNIFTVRYRAGEAVKAEGIPVTVEVAQGGTILSAGTYHGSDQSDIFTYGDIITAKVTVKASDIAAYSVQQDQTAIYCGDKQLTEAQDSVGTLNFTIRTADLGTGSFTLTAKYTGSENMTDASVNFSVTVSPARLEVTGAVVSDKFYDGTTRAEITEVSFSGYVNGDTSVPYSVEGAFADPNAGTDKSVLVTVALADDHYFLSDNCFPATGNIEKAEPNVSVSHTISAARFSGMILRDIALPEGWLWKTPEIAIGDFENGFYTFAAYYPETDNYTGLQKNITVVLSDPDHPAVPVSNAEDAGHTNNGNSMAAVQVAATGDGTPAAAFIIMALASAGICGMCFFRKEKTRSRR